MQHDSDCLCQGLRLLSAILIQARVCAITILAVSADDEVL